MTPEQRNMLAAAILDQSITSVREHREACGLDPVWFPNEKWTQHNLKRISNLIDQVFPMEN